MLEGKKHRYFQSLTLSVLIHALVAAILYLNEDISRFEWIRKKQVEVEILQDMPLVPTLEVPDLFLHKESQTPANYYSQKRQRTKQEMIASKKATSTNNSPSSFQLGVRQLSDLGTSLQLHPPTKHLNFDQLPPSQTNLELDNIREGFMTILNTDYSKFGNFYDRNIGNITYHWLESLNGKTKKLSVNRKHALRDTWTTVAEIQLNPLGDFVDSIILKTSGNEALDQAVVDGFKYSSPMINPPAEMTHKDGKIRIKAKFTLRMNPNMYHIAKD